MSKTSRVTVISTADWDHPIQTNKQHVARTLAAMGWQVLYIESLALRPITARVDGDRSRVLKRLIGALKGLRRVQPNILVASPLVLPDWRRRWVRRVNKVALAIQAWAWRLRVGRSELVLVYSPPGVLLLGALGALDSHGRTKVIYHCVDDIAAQPDMPADLIDGWERRLVEIARGVATTAPELTRRVRALGALNVLEQTNVVDFPRFETARAAVAARPRGRTVGFLGAISLYKFNLSWVIEAALALPDATFELYGPVGEGESGVSSSSFALPVNVHLRGSVALEEVPSVMANFDVAMIPAPLNRYTESMFPMKFFEYLAAGVPVVASDLPALRQFSEVLMVARTVDDFVSAIKRTLEGEGASFGDRVRVAARFTYEGRTREMLETIERW
ncbi:glycosyltransferase [Curtobacterium sp. MCSS17_007]|uniref:glycosyltransferase n=1 Tax=Curtobacterium sp. MCSS17_007 TaxID=2175646 RepID=UPI000DA90F80|nr:glycosyltransferase [Curtobacterium sp. MCSS17_007]WIE76143.1 glycosyltransferase [Curtobacterium sp. MCSS17_007]